MVDAGDWAKNMPVHRIRIWAFHASSEELTLVPGVASSDDDKDSLSGDLVDENRRRRIGDPSTCTSKGEVQDVAAILYSSNETSNDLG